MSSLVRARAAAQSLTTEDNFKAEMVQLDVTSDGSILVAREQIEILCATNHGSFKFNLLVNNAGIAGDPLKSFRENYTMLLDTNVSSIAVMMDT